MKSLIASVIVTISIVALISFNNEEERNINSVIEIGEECLANGDLEGAQKMINEISNECLIDYQKYKVSLLEDEVNKEIAILNDEKSKIHEEKEKIYKEIFMEIAPSICRRIYKIL